MLFLSFALLCTAAHGFRSAPASLMRRGASTLSHGLRKMAVLEPDDFLNMKEALTAPLDVMLHSKRFAGLRYQAKEVPARLKVFFPKLLALFHPVDLAILGVSLLSYRHILRFLHALFGKLAKRTADPPVPYEQSLFARLQEPVFVAIKYVDARALRHATPLPHHCLLV